MVQYEAMEELYKINLPAFDGPLDLLLHLIKEQKIDIYDIPIASITHQYLEYIEMMKELNLEVAGEFLLMAATLIHIKSRMLLPIEDTADTAEPEDPRLELVLRLLEYKAFKDAALGLQELEDRGKEVFLREQQAEMEAAQADEGPELSLFDLNLYDLLDAFKNLLDRAPIEVKSITKETLTIKDKMSMLITMLEQKQAVSFDSLFERHKARAHFIMTFIALLELIRLGLARVYQEQEFGYIWIINPEAAQSIDLRSLGVPLNITQKLQHAGRLSRPARKPARRTSQASFIEGRTGLPEHFNARRGDKLPRRKVKLP